jgi:AraC-like DNA-binding protein
VKPAGRVPGATARRRSSGNGADWIDIQRDADTGIESVHAHFHGHAYDAHDHDEMLVGVTQQGVQRFRCHRASHTSTPGRSILIEPAAAHDGHAPEASGFTYVMLYLPQRWIAEHLERTDPSTPARVLPAFRTTLSEDVQLGASIRRAFDSIHHKEGRLARDQCLDRMVALLAGQTQAAAGTCSDPRMVAVRDHLHDRMDADVGLDDLARFAGVDRFRLTRQFTRTFGLSPHAYLVRLRLRAARRMLATGGSVSQVAAAVGFADQSHLGRWFQRAYRLSPAAYQRSAQTF